MEAGARNRVEVVRGRVEGGIADDVLGFWADGGLLTPEVARGRLPEVVCVLRTPEGAVAGVNSAYSAAVELIGGRTFWIYRSALGEGARDDFQAMLGTCFELLADEFAAIGTGPVGVCAPIGDRAVLERDPEAVWLESGFLYAGFDPDGRQIRVRYFDGAKV